MSITEKASKYVMSIRCDRKRDYAKRYLRWITDGIGDEPDRGDLSYMGAQAVRIQLAKLGYKR